MKQAILKASACLFLYLWSVPALIAQNWELEKTVDDIEIYTRSIPGESLLELKIEFSLNTKLSPLVSILSDESEYSNWVYKSTKFEKVLSTGTGQGIYYGVVDFPWPLDDRDFVIQSTTLQDPETKVVTIESQNTICEGNPELDCYVRIPSHFNRWELNPINDNLVNVTYLLKSDPGGSIPDWLVNLAIDKGATQTIQNLKKMLSNTAKGTKLAYIQEK